ncbi:MAG: hypothetical protein ACK55Z_36250, partial [bacterium]
MYKMHSVQAGQGIPEAKVHNHNRHHMRRVWAVCNWSPSWMWWRQRRSMCGDWLRHFFGFRFCFW